MNSDSHTKQIINDLLAEARTFLDTNPISGIDLAHEALMLAHRSSDSTLQRSALDILIQLSQAAGLYHETLRYLKQLLPLLSDPKQRQKTLIQIGELALFHLRQFTVAEQAFRQALELDEAHNPAQTLALWTHLGITLAKQSKHREAEWAYHRALPYISQSVPPRRKAILYRALGNNAFSQGEYQKALDWFQKSLTIRQQLGDQRSIAIILSNIAQCYTAMGQYHQALQRLLHCQQIYTQLNDQIMLISTYNTLGTLFQKARQYERALDHYQAALQLAKQLQSAERIAKIYTNIGEVYRERGQYRKARQHFAKALRIFRHLHLTVPEEVATLANIGLTFKSEGKVEPAIRTLQYALARMDTPNRELIIGIHLALAELFLQQNNFNAAESELAQIDQWIDSVEFMHYAHQYHQLAAQIAFQQGDISTAYTHAQQAIHTLENFHHQQQQDLFAQLQFRYDLENEQQQLQLLQEHNQQLLAMVEHLQNAHDQLQSYTQHMHDMLHLIAHDLKNPLLSIRLLLYRIKKATADVTRSAGSLFQEADRTIDQMYHFIEQTLQQAKQSIAQPQQDITTISFQQLLHPLIQRYTILADRKHIKLSVHYHDPNDTISTHTGWLTQILDNLISNAIKYTYPDTVVTIRTRKLLTEYRIEISDQGPGIPSSEQHKVFQKFANISTTPTGGESSSGIGLYLVRRLATLLNYEVQFYSTEGQGTTFTVVIPFDIAVSPPSNPAGSLQVPSTKEEANPPVEHKAKDSGTTAH